MLRPRIFTSRSSGAFAAAAARAGGGRSAAGAPRRPSARRGAHHDGERSAARVQAPSHLRAPQVAGRQPAGHARPQLRLPPLAGCSAPPTPWRPAGSSSTRCPRMPSSALTIRGTRAPRPLGERYPRLRGLADADGLEGLPGGALATWVPQLDGRMRIRQQRLVERVFGQVPLAIDSLPARVTFFSQPELAAQVRLRPDAIRASPATAGLRAPGAGERSGPAGQGGRRGAGAELGRLPNAEQDAYACDLEGFAFKGVSTTAEAEEGGAGPVEAHPAGALSPRLPAGHVRHRQRAGGAIPVRQR